MADQNIKTNYATKHPDATDVSTPEQKHAARRQLNKDLREQQKPKSAPTIGQTTRELFSGKNIVETGRHAVKSGSASLGSALFNVGKVSLSVAGGAPPWMTGAHLPNVFLSNPGSVQVVDKPKKRKKAKTTTVVVSTRPEWIRF